MARALGSEYFYFATLDKMKGIGYYATDMLHIENTIEKTLILPAPRLTVWEKSFATPSAMASWFPDKIEGDFVVGQNYTMIWGEIRCECRLLELREGELFACQWHPGEACPVAQFPEDELTTIRFTLEDHEEGTKVVMIESGFQNIPESRRLNSFTENTSGWASELPKLLKFYQQ